MSKPNMRDKISDTQVNSMSMLNKYGADCRAYKISDLIAFSAHIVSYSLQINPPNFECRFYKFYKRYKDVKNKKKSF